MRELQRQNSALTILLSEMHPRLTILEQDVRAPPALAPGLLI